jgi:hypothetical protein
LCHARASQKASEIEHMNATAAAAAGAGGHFLIGAGRVPDRSL